MSAELDLIEGRRRPAGNAGNCKVCGQQLTGESGYYFRLGWWYCLEHAPAEAK